MATGTVHRVHEARRGQHEVCWQDTEDRVRVAIERDGAADDACIGGEAATPEAFGENDDIVAGLLFSRQQRAAENGLDAEQ